MTDEVREKYLKMVNIICEQFGLNKPNQIIYVCEAVENLIEPYMKENAELKADKEWLDNTNNEQTKVILELQAQIEKMKNDQKTAFIKGMRHFAKALKKYDQTEGAWTDYFEHIVDTVLNRELAE